LIQKSSQYGSNKFVLFDRQETDEREIGISPLTI